MHCYFSIDYDAFDAIFQARSSSSQQQTRSVDRANNSAARRLRPDSTLSPEKSQIGQQRHITDHSHANHAHRYTSAATGVNNGTGDD
jgi:hypothetical protein